MHSELSPATDLSGTVRQLTTRPSRPATGCAHPPSRIFTWWAYNYLTGQDDILCAGCCVCGAVLAGGAPAEEATDA